MEIPSWISDIRNDTLRKIFVSIWESLPAYVQAALTVDCPAVQVVRALSDPDAIAQARVGFFPNRQTVLQILVKQAALELPPPVLRAALVHELAHVYLRHFDSVLVEKKATPEVRAWQEWHADFVAIHLWGFKTDFETANQWRKEIERERTSSRRKSLLNMGSVAKSC